MHLRLLLKNAMLVLAKLYTEAVDQERLLVMMAQKFNEINEPAVTVPG